MEQIQKPRRRITVLEIIEKLRKCNPNRSIQLFDEDSMPYHIKDIFVDPTEDGTFSYIEIARDEQ